MKEEQNSVAVLREELVKLIYNFTVQAGVMGALIAVLNQEIPDLKDRMIEVLENSRTGSLMGQAMVDEAIDYVKTIRCHCPWVEIFIARLAQVIRLSVFFGILGVAFGFINL